ncbi:MAG: short-chain dehydrogenase [Jatrophihabitantaceae bacterium]|nr:short-chain dehydrogenase [Jatrophihabitantaceae bacterium]
MTQPETAARTVVITGASSGIGAAAAALFAEGGDRVVVVGRSPERTGEVADRIGGTALLADFERLGSVRELAAALLEACPRIDVLANNAGGVWPKAATTGDGFERTMQVNHLAPFLLTWLLQDRLVASTATVLATSSVAHRAGRLPDGDLRPSFDTPRHYRSLRIYGRSKLANILHARELQRRFGPSGLIAMSWHPGLVASQFGRDGGLTGALVSLPLVRSRMTTPEQAAARMLWLGGGTTGAGPDGPLPGEYHDGTTGRGAPGRASDQARSAALATRLWDASAQALDLR